MPTSWTFFIVPADTHASTDWSPTSYLDVSPRLIGGGTHQNKYAVNVLIFNCDPAYERYRDLLEALPTAVCDDRDVWFPAPTE